jgi:hypothetical protein
LRYISRLSEWLDHERPEILHVHSRLPAWICRIPVCLPGFADWRSGACRLPSDRFLSRVCTATTQSAATAP